MRRGTDRSHPRLLRMVRSTTTTHLRSSPHLSRSIDVRKGEQTRQEIIRKAAPIFNQKGYDGAALSDLIPATGLKKGGIYPHFGSKQNLTLDVSDHASNLATYTP